MYGYYGRNSQDLECCKCFENVAQTSRNYMYSYLDFRRIFYTNIELDIKTFRVRISRVVEINILVLSSEKLREKWVKIARNDEPGNSIVSRDATRVFARRRRR